MKIKDLKVGMSIIETSDDTIIRKIVAMGDKNLYIYLSPHSDEERAGDFQYLCNYEPVVEKQKIKLFRYTYTGNDKIFYETNWCSLTWEDAKMAPDKWGVDDCTLLKTEEKEIEI